MATRAGTYPRKRAKDLQRASIKKNWWRLALMSLVPAALSLLITVMSPTASIAAWSVPILLWTVLIGAASPMLFGTYSKEMGADAEVWTSKELAKLQGSGCEHFDHLVFENRDVDHVLVHPSGVYVIETKYTDNEVDLAGRTTDRTFRDWCRQAEDRSRRIRALLVIANQLRVDITPVVVVWGPRIDGTSKEIDGINVIRGRALLDEISRAAPIPRLNLRKQDAICKVLRTFISAAEKAERR